MFVSCMSDFAVEINRISQSKGTFPTIKSELFPEKYRDSAEPNRWYYVLRTGTVPKKNRYFIHDNTSFYHAASLVSEKTLLGNWVDFNGRLTTVYDTYIVGQLKTWMDAVPLLHSNHMQMWQALDTLVSLLND